MTQTEPHLAFLPNSTKEEIISNIISHISIMERNVTTLTKRMSNNIGINKIAIGKEEKKYFN